MLKRCAGEARLWGPCVPMYYRHAMSHGNALLLVAFVVFSATVQQKIPLQQLLVTSHAETAAKIAADWTYNPRLGDDKTQSHVVSQLKYYACPGNPSNFSWQPNPPLPALNISYWNNKTFAFIGGSTTRQMFEQFVWEFPILQTKASYLNGHFLFDRNQTNHRCCKYDGSHILDLRKLESGVLRAVRSFDYIIVNVGTWWDSKTIGAIIDVDGKHWNVTSHGPWRYTETNESKQKPSLRFEDMMEKALHLMLALSAPGSKIIWRSETFTSCPPGSGTRGGISSTLEKLHIPIINITQKTCAYVHMFPNQKLGPHLCFPSVAIRYWLQEFQQAHLTM